VSQAPGTIPLERSAAEPAQARPPAASPQTQTPPQMPPPHTPTQAQAPTATPTPNHYPAEPPQAPSATRHPPSPEAPPSAPENGPPRNGDDPYAAAVRAELHRIFIRQTHRLPLGVVALLTILVYMIGEAVPLAQRLAWLLAIAAGVLARFYVARLPLAYDAAPQLVRQRALQIAALWAVTGLFAGLGAFAWFPLLLLVDKAVISIAFVAWYSGAVVVSLVSPVAAFVFGVCLLGPLAMAWVFTATNPGFAVAAIVLGLLIFVRRTVDDAYESLQRAIRARLRETDLSSSLEHRTRELEAASRARTQFLAAASHDLRQPVTSMNLLLSALYGARDERGLRSVAAKLEAPLQALDEILSSLLEVSRLEAGTVRVEKRACNLRDALLAVQVEYTPRATAKRIAIRSEATNRTVMTDPDLLRRILRNLVDNAIKFTDEGFVHVSAISKGPEIVLRVRDTGRGIPSESLGKVFEDYYQADNPHRDRRQGLGLGLSIVKGLVELLDGRIDVQSAVGEGTTFEVRLPALQVRGAQPAAERYEALDAMDIAFLSVMVVDDEPLVRDAFATLLEPLGIDVDFAASPSEALALLDEAGAEPELAIVDFGLPGPMDGIALIGELRRRLPQVRAMLVTGDTRPEVIRRAADAGVNVLHKPFTAAQFTAALKTLKPAG
jgi:signal transduction histidine kinase